MIDFYIDTARRLIVTRATGQISLGDLTDHLQRIFRDGKFDPEFDALVVATDATAIPSATSVDLIAPLIRAWSKRRAGARWAFVLPDASSKMQAESGLFALKLTAIAARCFSTEGAAFGWLESHAGVPAASAA